MDQLSESVGRATTRERWLSRRAILLHLTVVALAGGCLAAGWWQATRALAGNGLSWFYSVEWPAFAVVAVVAWWHLVHEDPEQFRARKQTAPIPAECVVDDAGAGRHDPLTVSRLDARIATVLAVLVGADSVLGVAAVVFVPFSRPSGLVPSGPPGIYLAHAVLGVPMIAGATVLLLRCRRSSRLGRLTGWVGGVGVGLAGVGGLLTGAHPARLAGMALMLLGAATAAFGYVMPSFEKLT